MADDTARVPAGRLRRLARIGALGPRAAVAAARDVLQHAAGDDPGERLGEVLYDTLGRLKGGTLKAGQIVAQVSDALPEPARVRLARLFSSAPPLEWSAVAAVIEAELGAPPDQLFAEIDRAPFAGASLGQVHRARLADGAVVAVKVQYPGVADALAHDLDLLGGVARTVTSGGLLFDASAYFNALRDGTLAELDYRREARWLERMRAAVAEWPDLVVPRLVAERSGGRVLTCELLEGDTLNARFEVPASADERRDLGFRTVRAVLGPLFRADVVNPDAHPGNFVVLPDQRLGLLDFGAAIEVPPRIVAGLAALVPALIDGPDAIDRLGAAGLRMRRPDHDLLAELVDAAGSPLRGRRDFATEPVVERLAKLKQRHPVATLRFRVEVGLLPVVRALIGVAHTLRRLRVEGDLGAVVRELSAARR